MRRSFLSTGRCLCFVDWYGAGVDGRRGDSAVLVEHLVFGVADWRLEIVVVVVVYDVVVQGLVRACFRPRRVERQRIECYVVVERLVVFVLEVVVVVMWMSLLLMILLLLLLLGLRIIVVIIGIAVAIKSTIRIGTGETMKAGNVMQLIQIRINRHLISGKKALNTISSGGIISGGDDIIR